MVDGQRTRCRVAPATGASPPSLPLLLLHGLGCSSDAWVPSLRVFAGHGLAHPVYAPDMPGYGCTRCTRGALTMTELADWTTRLMDTLGVTRAHIAGNSMGCQVALALARRHPERVGGLVLLGPTTGKSQVPIWRYVIGLLLDGFAESPSYNLTLLRMYAQMGLRRYLETTRHMMADNPLAHVAEEGAPCLVVRGGHDRIISERIARELAAMLPRGEYQALDSTAHAAEYNTPELFVSATLEFLARVDTSVSQQAPSPAQAALTPPRPSATLAQTFGRGWHEARHERRAG